MPDQWAWILFQCLAECRDCPFIFHIREHADGVYSQKQAWSAVKDYSEEINVSFRERPFHLFEGLEVFGVIRTNFCGLVLCNCLQLQSHHRWIWEVATTS